MLIIRLFLVMPLVLLSACASSPKQPNDAEKTITPAKAVQPQQKAAKKEAKTAIEPDVMFMLMTAELAGQRGRYDIALEGYMEAAKRVNDPRFAERATMIAMYMKDAGKTNEAVALWLRQDKNNQSAYKVAALSALTAGDKKAAVGYMEALLKLDPAGFEKSSLELVSMLQKEEKNKLTYEVLDELSVKHPDNATLFFVKSLLAMQMNDKGLAGRDIQKALAVQPEWDKALMFQAQIALASGDMAKAVADLKAAAAKHPKDGKIAKLLAQLLIKAKDYRQAEQVYRQLIKANPEDSESQFALALVYLQLDDEEPAEEIFTKLLGQAQWQDQAGFYLGKLEEKRGNLSEALEWFDKVKNGPTAFDAGISSVILLAKDKQYEAADVKLDTLANQFPKQKLRLTLTKAELLNQQKRYQQAYELLTAASEEVPDDKDLLYARALVADRVGKPDVSEADLKKILAKNPDNAEALNALGYTLVEKTTRYAEAEQYLLHALKLAPDEAVILDSYGWLQFKRGNLAGALDYLQRAYAKQKENEIAAHFAEVLWALGKKDEAKKIFKEAIKKAPEDEYLLEFKSRVLDKGF